jgi:hypothetical protein
MPAATFTAYGLTRSLWPQKSIYEEILKNSPVLGLIRKDTNFSERVRYIDVGIGAPQGVGANFGDAKRFKTASRSVEFGVSTTTYYGNFSIDGKLYRVAKYTGNKALIVDPMTRDSKNLMTQIKNDLSTFIHGNGGGALGRMTAGSAPTSSATITLASGADVRRIDVGMALQTSAADGTSGSINNGYVTVASIGGTETAPTITVDQSTWQAGIAGVAASDYIFRAGAVGTGAGGDGLLDGFESWCPSHTGSPGTFKGVNRNTYANKLAGQCLVGTAMSPRQRIMRASRLQADVGGASGRLVYAMSTRQWENLYNELANANALRMTKAPAQAIGKISTGVEYDAIEIMGAGGKLDVVADPWMPDNVERLLNMDAWTLASTGELVHWDDGANPDNPMLEDSADAREIRAVGDMVLYCEAPWYQVRVSVTA